VGNAAKFTRSGVISITAGVGIPKEKISKIFGAFEQ
ncbi:uncharacterized protein HaLaN_33165, partial [Haematococcus lacustris]